MSKNYRNRSSTRPLWTCYIAITSHKKSTEYFTADVLIGRRKDVIPNKSANLIQWPNHAHVKWWKKGFINKFHRDGSGTCAKVMLSHVFF